MTTRGDSPWRKRMGRFLTAVVAVAGIGGVVDFCPAADAPKATTPTAKVDPIVENWSGPALRRIAVAEATASSCFAPESSQYQPARAVDGDRHTKWVASVAPTVAAPQWIALELFGVQEVSAVAVFGERLDNDGVRDASIEVLGPGDTQYRTVATIRDARSPHWLATFPPTAARKVRLAITRSGGPSPHTDVYEVEVYGRPLSSEQLKRYAAERLAGSREQVRLTQSAWTTLRSAGQPAALGQTVAALDARVQAGSDRFNRWDAATGQERLALAGELERLELAAARMRPKLARAAAVWPTREKALAELRRFAAGTKVDVARDGNTLRIANDRVAVAVNEKDGTWDAAWSGQVAAAVHRVGLAIEADGRVIAPQAAPAQTAAFRDALGAGLEIRQRWPGEVAVERSLRVYDGRGAVVVACRIVNTSPRDVTLGSVRPVQIDSTAGGWWHLGSLLEPPSAIGFSGGGPPCRPAFESGASTDAAWGYGSGEMLALAPNSVCHCLPRPTRNPLVVDSPVAASSAGAEFGPCTACGKQWHNVGLVLGALAAKHASPSVSVGFVPGEGGTSLGASLAPRVGALKAGATLALDPVWLGADPNPWEAIERYADAAAAHATAPVRTGANALWCSWYPIRMGISEKIVLEHAEIVARHFKPLGMDVIQMDHGWQQGDICGDWTPNERFPHGLPWLAEQLRTRWGLKMGLWIAPTQVAFTSRLFREHPEWMLQNAQGKPADCGRWFWAPNPSMALLDASKPEAERWIEQTFARLTAEGAAYYKIDFIAGSPALDRAMAAIRRGAGDKAWIRYCQTPPLLSAGLASSSYIGADTGDAGLPSWMQLARENAPLLAASYWANDRLYHREVCDEGVGPNASVEEARFRLAQMTLSGCSIAISDDFRQLNAERIRMIQQCLPPGNPPSRPLDLFQRELPSVWHVRCRAAQVADRNWDVVGMLNFEDQPQQRTVDFASLGIGPNDDVAVFEFWEERLLGVQRRQTTLRLAPQTARVLVLRRLLGRPQLLATNMHLLAGLHEVPALAWDQKQLTLSGTYRRAPGLEGKAYFYVPEGYRPLAAANLIQLGGRLWMQQVRFPAAEAPFSLPFARGKP